MLNRWPYYEEDEIRLVTNILQDGNVSTIKGNMELDLKKTLPFFKL